MNRTRLMQMAPLTMATLAVLLIAVAAFVAIRHFLANDKPARVQVVHQIALMKPPPLPEIKEKPPEPEVKKEEVKLPEPKPDAPQPDKAVDNEPPPGQALGVDANGQAGGDSFGLLGNKGGRALIGGGGDEKQRYAWYAGLVQQSLYDRLEKEKRLRDASYKLVVKVWVGGTGNVERVEIGRSSGNLDIDNRIKLALAQVSAISERPPQDMPQPMNLRITSRM